MSPSGPLTGDHTTSDRAPQEGPEEPPSQPRKTGQPSCMAPLRKGVSEPLWCLRNLTNEFFFDVTARDFIVHLLVPEEVEGLESVEDEVPQVLSHVGGQDAPIEAVDGPSSIHDLKVQGLRAGRAPEPWGHPKAGSGANPCALSASLPAWPRRCSDHADRVTFDPLCTGGLSTTQSPGDTGPSGSAGSQCTMGRISKHSEQAVTQNHRRSQPPLVFGIGNVCHCVRPLYSRGPTVAPHVHWMGGLPTLKQPSPVAVNPEFRVDGADSGQRHWVTAGTQGPSRGWGAGGAGGSHRSRTGRQASPAPAREVSPEGPPRHSHLSNQVLEAAPWDPRVMLLEGFG